jgi:hypothetical protein
VAESTFITVISSIGAEVFRPGAVYVDILNLTTGTDS